MFLSQLLMVLYLNCVIISPLPNIPIPISLSQSGSNVDVSTPLTSCTKFVDVDPTEKVVEHSEKTLD